MTNATALKYNNLYTVNRYRNELFQKWLKAHYIITESIAVWSYGKETFKDIVSGETLYSEAKVMQRYVKDKNPYFRDFCHFDKWLDSSCKTQEEFFGLG